MSTNWLVTTSEESKDDSLKIGFCEHDHPCSEAESSSHSRPQPHISPRADPKAFTPLPSGSSASAGNNMIIHGHFYNVTGGNSTIYG